MLVYLEGFEFEGKKYDLEMNYQHRPGTLLTPPHTTCTIEQGWCDRGQEVTPQVGMRIEDQCFTELVAACLAEIARYPDDYRGLPSVLN